MNYMGEKPSAPQFMIYPDDKGQAEATLYEDDGLSPAYKNGVFRRTRVRLSSAGSIGTPGRRRGLSLKVEPTEGTFKPAARALEFVVPMSLTPAVVSIDGKMIRQTNRDGMFWSRRGNVVSIRIPDDGKAHTIGIR